MQKLVEQQIQESNNCQIQCESNSCTVSIDKISGTAPYSGQMSLSLTRRPFALRQPFSFQTHQHGNYDKPVHVLSSIEEECKQQQERSPQVITFFLAALGDPKKLRRLLAKPKEPFKEYGSWPKNPGASHITREVPWILLPKLPKTRKTGVNDFQPTMSTNVIDHWRQSKNQELTLNNGQYSCPASSVAKAPIRRI